jgi:hypothetical protein
VAECSVAERDEVLHNAAERSVVECNAALQCVAKCSAAERGEVLHNAAERSVGKSSAAR